MALSCLPTKNDERPQDGQYVATSEQAVRAGFIRKVYTVLTLQFLFTVGLSAVAAFTIPIRNFFSEHTWVLYIALGVALACLIPLLCFRSKFPFNLILLIIFTIAYSVLIAVVVATYFRAGAGVIVLEAFALTAIVFLTITAYILVTKKDFSFLAGFLFAALMILVVAAIANFALGFVGARSKGFTFAISVLGALVFTGYLLFDTSMVVTRLGPDQWIEGAISLYLDVANLFMCMLSIFSLAD